MSDVSKTYNNVLWSGRPWILPSAVARTALLILFAALVFWVELFFKVAYIRALNAPVIIWTGLVLLLAWLLTLMSLLVLRASHKYVLRNDSLEIKTGILGMRRFVIVPSGFSDLEVKQSLLERVIGYGSISIRSQSETDSDRRMVKIRNPTKIAEQVRYIMSRPIVRMEPGMTETKP